MPACSPSAADPARAGWPLQVRDRLPWYATTSTRPRLDQLIGCCTEADLFLSLHRQSRELWGTECRLAQDEADHLVTKVLAAGEADQSVIRKVVARARRRRLPEVLAQRS